MEDQNESQYEEWQKDVEYLVGVLKESFESDEARYNLDELNDILYVELEGLDEYSDEEIIEIAEPILNEIELDFEDVVLLPLGWILSFYPDWSRDLHSALLRGMNQKRFLG